MRNAVTAPLTSGFPLISMPQLSLEPSSGIRSAAAAARTPGSASIAGIMSSTARCRCSIVSCAGMVASITATASGRMPGLIPRRLATLRSSSPAPAASSTATAICATTSAPSRRPPRPEIPPARAVAIVACRSLRHSATSGMIAIADAASIATASDVASTVQSSDAVSASAPSGSDRRSTLNPPAASAAPTAPARTPINSDSSTSCWTSRCRPAPSAVRTASSLLRPATWPSISADTFTQAINRMSPIAANVASSPVRTSPTRNSRSGVTAGANVEHMQAPLAAIGAELGRTYKYPPSWDKTKTPAVTPLREFLVGDVRAGLLATFAAMGLILLIACVNVSALMLGQVAGRNSELAVRTALGAGRQRLVQQLVLESLLIGVLAGAVGAALAAGGFSVLLRSLPLGALAETASLDWTVLATSLAVAMLAASAIAIIPAIALWRSDLQATIATARAGGLSGRGGRLEGALVVAQIAVAVLLAAGAGLLLRSVANLRGINPGIRPDAVAVIDATIPAQLTMEQRHRAVLDMIPAMEALPGVRAAAAAERIPLLGSSDNWGMEIKGKPEVKGAVTAFRMMTDGYFKAMGIAVRRGRGFEPADKLSAERLVVINEALAAKYFSGEDPIGRYLETFDDKGERIIGVAANVAENTLTDPPVPARYMLYEHVPMMLPSTTFVVSGASADDVPRLLSAARTVIQRDGGSRLALERTVSMASVFEDAVGAPGRLAMLLSLLAGLALLLGAIGVYGMISHFVTRRVREYGIRLALGLPPGRVVSLVLGRGLRLVAIGSAVGVIAALALTRLLASLLYGVGATDPGVLAGAVAAL